ncbi:MAG TPA: nucleotidyl transferase AbiEii/AbiGii toxin family protein [Flavobacteriaceae bacterium]|nr:nucleotidyl transferase AbiEii/AbiGii toxin family protein [Flavobacteriaceae bacterium]
MSVSLRKKSKVHTTPIESAFLKSETLWKEIVLKDVVEQLGIKSNKDIKIKIEVDRNPPLHFQTEEKLLLRPFSFYVKCFDLPNLFAGKMHALLFRKWKNRVKGRDWYDMEWYIRKGVSLNLEHFLRRAQDAGDWEKPTISKEELLDLLRDEITTTAIEKVKAAMQPFIQDFTPMDIWSQQYFLDVIQLIKVEQ